MAGVPRGTARPGGGRDMRAQSWILVGGFLVGCCLSSGLTSVRAGDGLVSDDGWRPKGHHRQAAVTGPAEAFTAPSRPVAVLTQPPAAVDTNKPFDWRDDLYGPAALTGQAVVSENTRDPSLQPHRSAAPAVTIRHWCRCEHSSICGHCGLKRPILAVYQDTPMPTAEPRAMLANSDQLRPPLDRLRLAFERANDRVQETLGRF